jgi:hypothetical protein
MVKLRKTESTEATEREAMAVENAALLATNAQLGFEIEALRSALVEREAKAAPLEHYIRLKDAAGGAHVPYNRCLTWLNEGLLKSVRRGGRHFVTQSSVVAQRIFRDGR